MSQSATPYDPSLRALVGQTDVDWGDPDKNLKGLIKYQIGPEFDRAMWGVNTIDGELIGIQGPEKQRKSSYLCNLIKIFAQQLSAWICIDTLESGMPPKAYRDMLIAMIATQIMIGRIFGLDRSKWPPVSSIKDHPQLKSELRLSRKFLRFGRRTEFQQAAIDEAKIAASCLPVSIFGPSAREGQARNLELSMERWDKLYRGEYETIKEAKHVVFCTDHIQQYSGYAGDDYHGIEAVVAMLSDFVVTHPGSVVIAVSQVSLGSVRAASSGTGEMVAKGGAKLAAEVNTLFQTKYAENSDYLILETPRSRDEKPPVMIQEIEQHSGAFLAPARPAHE